MEVRRGAKDDELGVVPKYLYNDEITIIVYWVEFDRKLLD